MQTARNGYKFDRRDIDAIRRDLESVLDELGSRDLLFTAARLAHVIDTLEEESQGRLKVRADRYPD